MTDSGQAQDFGSGAGGDVARLLGQARTSLKARDYEAAKAGFKSIYEFLSRRGLGEGLEAMECLADLGATHMALKEYDAALTEYARLATIMERNLGEANAELRQHLRRYAQACDVAGKLNEAKQLYSRANDLERRYGAVPSRSSAGSLPGRLQSPAAAAPGPSAAETPGGGSTFAEAIQDAVARSMAKLDNRGKPVDNPSVQTSKQTPAGPRPFVTSPIPPSPFQNLVNEVTKPAEPTGAAAPAQPSVKPPSPLPQGFTGSPAVPNQDSPPIPSFQVPKELSDSQFIYKPRGRAGHETGEQAGAGTGSGQYADAGKPVSGGLPVAPVHQPTADPGAVRRAIEEQRAAKEAAAMQAAQQAASEFSSGWDEAAQSPTPLAEQPQQEFVQEPEVPWADTEPAAAGNSGTQWRAPQSTAGSASELTAQPRPIIEEGNYEPISGDRPSNYQSVEESLDKVFGSKLGEGQERGSSIYADKDSSKNAASSPGMESVSGEAGNSPVRRTNPSLNSSKLRQMQNRGTSPDPRPEQREESNEASAVDSFSTPAPLGYSPTDYDPSVPTQPWAAPGQQSPPGDFNSHRSPGERRATAEWQVEPSDEVPTPSDVDIADPHLPTEVHPDSDASKAMAQWGVTISDQPEEHYPPIRQDDRRQGLQPHEEETPPGVPKPFDRRQRPKSMKGLRSRFGQMDPSTDVDDSEFEDSQIMNTNQPADSSPSSFAPPATRPLPPKTPPRRLADNSISNMTPPELPPDQMLTQPAPELPPPPPPVIKGSGPRGLLERAGAYAEGEAQNHIEPQGPESEGVSLVAEVPDENKPSSMISRLVSKRHHDTSVDNANPSFAADELQVPPRIRSMV
ncbi:MAG TPA: hypothetical protein PKZ32_13855, partial [Candidatus Melainabacteria bacterium]|nr:hypothetical protein [Candidatus Melainabacteria bacterium]